MKNIKNGVDEVKKFLFFDTCALLNLDFVKMIDGEDTIGVISDVVYRELEDIKSSGRKDEMAGYRPGKDPSYPDHTPGHGSCRCG